MVGRVEGISFAGSTFVGLNLASKHAVVDQWKDEEAEHRAR